MTKNGSPTVSRFRKKLIVSSVAAALGTGAVAASSAELEEIVVTARQRSESSQDVPMMVQSLSGELEERRGLPSGRFVEIDGRHERANHDPRSKHNRLPWR